MSDTAPTTGTARVKRGMAEMLKGGVIMDVVTAEQAKIAEDAGAVAVMALERVPADIRAQGGVSRMSDPDMIDGIIEAVSIPVMAKARIGHFVEAQVLQSLGVDYIDESEVLTPADYANHIDKWAFDVPFVCGATNLGEALRRITEGRGDDPLQGRGGHRRRLQRDHPHASDPRRSTVASMSPRRALRRRQRAAGALRPRRRSRRPASCRSYSSPLAASPLPADAAMMMQLGAEGVFVGSGIFKSGNPEQRAKAIVKATTFHDDPDVIAKVSRGLGEAMVGINVEEIPQPHRLAERGW
jgi:pyridoxal 5'-phosphate synthase pdxS subunit